MTKYIKHTFLFLVFIQVSVLLNAQTNISLNVDVSKKEILIGERLQYILKIENLRRGNFFTPDINIPDSLNAFEVLQRGNQDSVITGQFISYRRLFTITSFDSGLQTIPSVSVELNFIGVSSKNKPVLLNSDPVTVLVSYDTTQTELHDIKDIIPVEGGKSYWIYYVIAGVLICALVLFIILKKRKKPSESAKPEFSVPPLEEALSALNDLKQRRLKNPADVKTWFSDLFNIARVFVSRKSGKSFSHLTSDELSIELNTKFGRDDDFNRFLQILRMTDAVKFAKFLPTEEERSGALLTTEKIIKTLDEIYK